MSVLALFSDSARRLLRAEVELRYLQEANETLQAKVRTLQTETADLRTRVVKLEALREADHQQMLAENARFEAETDLRLLRMGCPDGR